jgi:tRNA dimethylallyltransferase
MEDKAPIVIIAGATGVGKTAVAVALARLVNGAIVSADSQQVYRGLTIGTAKPTPAECGEIAYAGIDLADFDEQFDLARFIEFADAEIAQCQRAGQRAIVAGGTGLYLQGLLEGVFEGPPVDAQLRAALFARLAQEGEERVFAELQEVDPEAARAIHPRDHVRLVRALEVHRQTGHPLSELQRESRQSAPRWPYHFFALTRPREKLYRIIDERVDAMLAAGWLEEVRGLAAQGFTTHAPAAKALGYAHLLRHLAGEFELAEAVEEIKTASRRYAKRQLTWLRHMQGVQWLDIDGQTPAQTAAAIEELLSRPPIA